MQPKRIHVTTGKDYREERWLGLILIGYVLLSIFLGIMFGIAVSKFIPGARFPLSILAILFTLALMILNRGVSPEHRRIIGWIFAGFYMLTGVLLLFHPYLWIFGVAGIARSLTYVHKYVDFGKNNLNTKGAAIVIGAIVVVLIIVLAIIHLRQGDKALPEFNEIQTSLSKEITTSLNEDNYISKIAAIDEPPTCQWVEVNKVNYETRYLVYYRSLLVKNATNSTVYDIKPQHIGFNITNYLDVPIEVKVEYLKEAPWYGINEEKSLTLQIKSSSTYSYTDYNYSRLSGCDVNNRCNLTVTMHKLASSVMRIEETRQPVITTTTECQ
jgi:hypothetical protein